MGGTREVWVAATALATVLAAQQGVAAERSGVVQVRIADVNVQGAGGKLTPINVGDPVFADQVLRTGPRGRAKVVLLDRSAILLGPSSEVTVRRFSYDREEGVGELALEAAKGLFRFVGGVLSKRRPVQLATAHGTIGIRGAVVVVKTNDDGSQDVYFMYGDEATWDPANGGETAHLNKPGYRMHIGADGGVSIDEAPLAELDDLLRGLEGEPGSPTPALAGTEVFNQVSPEVLELFEAEPGRVQELLRDLNNDPGADFDRTREVLDRLGVGPGGTG
ncbi:MAG: FecR domain-containing protein [Gammaproteobacteria bacterium]